MADETNGKPPAAADKDKTTGAKSPPKVRVLVNNLGPQLYQAGAVTEDAEIVALLGDARNLVEKVK